MGRSRTPARSQGTVRPQALPQNEPHLLPSTCTPPSMCPARTHTHTCTHLCSSATVSLRGSNIWSVRSVRLRTSRMQDMMSYSALRFSLLSRAFCVCVRTCVYVCVLWGGGCGCCVGLGVFEGRAACVGDTCLCWFVMQHSTSGIRHLVDDAPIKFTIYKVADARIEYGITNQQRQVSPTQATLPSKTPDPTPTCLHPVP